MNFKFAKDNPLLISPFDELIQLNYSSNVYTIEVIDHIFCILAIFLNKSTNLLHDSDCIAIKLQLDEWVHTINALPMIEIITLYKGYCAGSCKFVKSLCKL